MNFIFLRGPGACRQIGLILCAGFLLAVLALVSCNAVYAQETSRKLKTGMQPEYPELAKKNKIKGTARVQLLVTVDGKVKDVKVLGGNPVLVQAVVSAVSKWKYEPAAEQSIVVLKFDFGS